MSDTENTADELNIKAAAALRQINPTTLYEWCRARKLTALRNGSGRKAEYLIKLSDLDQFLTARSVRRAIAAPNTEPDAEKAGAAQTPPPQTPAEKAQVSALATQVTALVEITPTQVSPAKPSKNGKTPVARQKDQMRKLSVPEMVDIINWLSNRIGMQWDAKGMASPPTRPEMKTRVPMPYPADDRDRLI